MPQTQPAVTYFGYALSSSGYGTAARAYLAALRTASVTASIVCVDAMQQTLIPYTLDHGYCDPRNFHSVLLWHVDPNQMARRANHYPRAIAVAAWEADSLPASHVEKLNRVGEVWVPSTFNEATFRRQLSVPVFRIPHPVHSLGTPCFDRTAFDRELGLPPGCFVVLSVGTWQERKNLSAVVEAFLRAFPRDTNAHLVIKTSFSFVSSALANMQVAAAIRRAAPPDLDEAAGRIHIYANPWPISCMASLYARADCYLSLHRGEGWCYPLFDAACLGIPVIATEGSGPMDYLDPRVHGIVRAELIHPPERYIGPRFFFNSDMQWYDPDIAHAASLLREVHEDYDAAHRQAQQASAALRENFAAEKIGRTAAAHLASFAEAQPADTAPLPLAAAG